MTTQLIPTSEIQTMALAVAKSGLFGVKTQEQAMALMLIAQAEGMHPAIAARDYHVINGRPSLRADAMLARFQSAGGKVEWKKYSDDECVGVFSHPSGGSVEIAWTLAQATKAGLTSNPTWKKFSRAMLRARCISEGIRTVFPGVVSGFYTPEEVADFAPAEKDVTPPPATPEKVKESIAKAKATIAPKPATKPAGATIEGQATHVSDPGLPPEAGDLSDIGTQKKPDDAALSRVVHAFAKIGYTLEALEAEYGKRIDEWGMADIDEAREVFKVKKAEYDASQSAGMEI